MRRSTWLACLLLLVACVPCTAQEGDGSAPAEPALAEIEIHTAPVEIDGTTLFRVRGVTAYPAETRAAAIAERIRGLARDPEFAVAALRVEESELGPAVVGGTVRVMVVGDADGRLEGVAPKTLANVVRVRVEQAIDAYRAARTHRALIAAGWRAFVATLALLLLLGVVLWVTRRLDAALERRFRARVGPLSIQSFEIVRAERLWGVAHGVVSAVRALAAVGLIATYARYVLTLLPWTRGIGNRFADYVLDPLATLGRGALAMIPDLVFLAILVVVTRYVLRLIRAFFDAVDRGEVMLAQFDREWAGPTYRILRLVVVVFALVVGYPYIPGSDSEAFKGLSLFLGVIFSLGSSSAIANIIAGYTLTYRRAFRLGDRVRIGDVFGDVTTMRLQVTHVRTLKNEEVIVPNSSILNSEVTNYTTLAASAGLILHTSVGIGYETPWRQVEAMLLLAAERTAGLLRDPQPFVLHKTLGDFAVTYELNVYCNDPRAMTRLYTELHRQILDVFNEYGVQIMTPAYEGDPEQPKVVPPSQWSLPPAPPLSGPGRTAG